MNYYDQGYKDGYHWGFWIGAISGVTLTLILCLGLGIYLT